jgi:hypothetical protein
MTQPQAAPALALQRGARRGLEALTRDGLADATVRSRTVHALDKVMKRDLDEPTFTLAS